MSRRLKLSTRELGDLELLLIFQEGSEWELEWQPLQHTALAGVFSVVSKELMDHALHGWTQPFVKALGLAPRYALHKVPKVCGQHRVCLYYRPHDCTAVSKKRPWCFEPAGLEGEAASLGQRVVQAWGEGVYVVVVRNND